MADNDGFESPLDNPGLQATIDDVLKEEVELPVQPHVAPLPDTFVRLQGGTEDGKREVEVRELTGESEERLAKARTSSDPTRFYNVLLEEGVVDLDSATINSLLVGDRDAIMLGIRKATYGNDIDLRVYCEDCAELFDAVITVDEIPVRPLESDRTFEVKLRKGGRAQVRLAVGSDQNAYMGDPSLNASQKNTVLLERCVEWVEINGDKNSVAGFPSLVRDMGILDRRAILKELDDRQPGPRYDGLEIEHDECGGKIPVQFGLDALFPGL